MASSIKQGRAILFFGRVGLGMLDNKRLGLPPLVLSLLKGGGKRTALSFWAGNAQNTL